MDGLLKDGTERFGVGVLMQTCDDRQTPKDKGRYGKALRPWVTDGAGMFFRNNECLRSSIKIAGVAVKTTTPLPLREDAGGTITSELE